MKVILFDYPESVKDISNYELLGFKVKLDDEVNNIYSAELDFKGFDLAAVYHLMDDCSSYDLKPNVKIDDVIYTFDEGFPMIDDLSGNDVYVGCIGTPLQ